MVRQVYDRDMVAHLWANKSQDSARVSSGNFFFNGATLYSYGSHFVCAHHLPEQYATPDGCPVALFNAGRYSMTTGRHMDAAWRALPRFVRRVDVPGLDENMVRRINLFGMRDVIAELVRELRHVAENAARPRIRADTRAGHFSAARELRDNAAHFATVDAGRRDLSADNRKEARAVVRMLAALAIPEDGTDKAGAEALAFELNKSWYADRMAELIAAAEREIGNAVYNVECGNFRTAERYIQDADRCAAGARDYAKKARRELPRKFAREWKKYAPGSAWRVELESKARAEAVADAREVWANAEARAREALAARDMYMVDRLLIGEARRAFETLHGEPGDAERRAFVATLQSERDAWKAKGEAEQARECMAAAVELFAAGKFSAAAQTAQTAAHKFQRAFAGRSDMAAHRCIDEATALRDTAEARKPEEYAAMLADWREAKPGARFPEALHGRERAAFLRLSADGKRVETSQGAEVPARVCSLVWRLIGEARANQSDSVFTGENAVRLGHFTLDRIDREGNVSAGCHFIPFAELAGIAARLNFAPHS